MDHAMRVLRLVERENIDDVYPVNVSKKWFTQAAKPQRKIFCGISFRLCAFE